MRDSNKPKGAEKIKSGFLHSVSRLRLLTTNSASHRIRRVRRLLIYGECLKEEHPEIVEELSKGRVALSSCPEAEHINLIALKVASIIARVKLEEIVVLTTDGSPHCLQLHHAVEEACKIAGFSPRHMVVEGGRVVEVSREAVKTARYLSKVDRLLRRSASP